MSATKNENPGAIFVLLLAGIATCQIERCSPPVALEVDTCQLWMQLDHLETYYDYQQYMDNKT